jgi:hypothetical protein
MIIDYLIVDFQLLCDAMATTAYFCNNFKAKKKK